MKYESCFEHDYVLGSRSTIFRKIHVSTVSETSVSKAGQEHLFKPPSAVVVAMLGCEKHKDASMKKREGGTSSLF